MGLAHVQKTRSRRSTGAKAGKFLATLIIFDRHFKHSLNYLKFPNFNPILRKIKSNLFYARGKGQYMPPL